MVLISIVLLAKVLLKNLPRTRGTDGLTHDGWIKVVLAVGALVIYAALLNSVGFLLCTFLLALFFVKVIGRKGWTSTVIIALCCSAGAFLLFNVLLDAQLPMGFLSF